MATIDKLDVGIYNQYARRTQSLEEISRQYNLDQASFIPAHALTVATSPKMGELDELFGIVRVENSYALIEAPVGYDGQRRSSFSFFRVAPSMGSFEEETESERLLQSIKCEMQEDKANKKILEECFGQIKEINSWLSFIIGRMGQFLQG